MSDKYDYVRIDESNRSLYEAYLHDIIAPDRLDIGIVLDGKPYGGMVIMIAGRTLSVQNIRIADTPDRDTEMIRILGSLAGYAVRLGLSYVECSYIDDSPGITERMLRDAGFTDFKEETFVYRTNAYTLGSLLKAGPDAQLIKGEAIRVMESGIVKCFTEIDSERMEPLHGLLPREDLSFMTLDRWRRCLSYVVISELPDGGLFLADMICVDGREKDMAGLLYMSLGKVFMEIEPDGDFYIAAVADRYKKFADYLFAPVRPLIHSQKLMKARRKV